MIEERRKTNGIAVVTTTERASAMKQLCRAAEVPERVLVVQDGLTWPELRPPAVLDTIGMPVATLVALLANPPIVKRSSVSPVGVPRAVGASTPPAARATMADKNGEFVPLGVLADPNDWCALRLLLLCPAVRMISTADMGTLRRWVRHLDGALPPHTGTCDPAWLIAPPPPVPSQLTVDQATAKRTLRDPFLLRLLAALPNSLSYVEVAARCKVSASTLARMLRAVRAALDLPPGDVSRVPPAKLAAMIVERLGADSPTNAKQRVR